MSEAPPPGPPSYGPPIYGPPPGPPPSYLPYEPPVLPPPPSKRRWLGLAIAGVVAMTVLAAAIAIPLVADSGEVTLDGVEFFETSNTTHSEKEIDYDVTPPVGGRHNPIWLDCGVYDEPVPNENVVHDLEHGTVWLTYRPDLGQGEMDALADLLPQNGILSPYDDQEAPVVVTVWGTRLELDGADDPRLPLFIARYGAGETAPEPGASCAGGQRNPPSLRGTGTAI